MRNSEDRNEPVKDLADQAGMPDAGGEGVPVSKEDLFLGSSPRLTGLSAYARDLLAKTFLALLLVAVAALGYYSLGRSADSIPYLPGPIESNPLWGGDDMAIPMPSDGRTAVVPLEPGDAGIFSEFGTEEDGMAGDGPAEVELPAGTQRSDISGDGTANGDMLVG
jgi:hypothetical protein